MPAKSKSQQKFFGMVHAVQTGKLSPSKVSKKVKDTAKNIKKKDAKDFASTKHKGLPNKKVKKERKNKLNLKELIPENSKEQNYQLTEEDKSIFLEKIKNFNSYYSKFGESNLKEVVDDFNKIVIVAENIILNETEDWFDKITINKNMKELKKINENFSKTAKDISVLKERMISLFDDMGHILNKYFDIN